MYIMIKTEDPEHITKIEKNYERMHYFYADNIHDAKKCLEELPDTDDLKYWSKYYLNPEAEKYNEFVEYLRSVILDKNKLSNQELKELCYEYLEWLELPNRYDLIKTDISSINSLTHVSNYEEVWGKYWNKLFLLIDKYTQTRNNLSRNYIDSYNFLPINFEENLPPIDTVLIELGALKEKFYPLIYYFDFLGIPIDDPELKRFWEFYKKTLNVYVLTNEAVFGTAYVVPKPDEIFIKNDITHCSYGSKYYCDGIKVPKWLYNADKEDLDIKKFNNLKNVDVRSIFIKKAGIENFIKKGILIDSWENYPENEWWAKSEYKLIDMSEILVESVVYSGRSKEVEYYDYAPFLCMKNQTTGEYHLEGVSPECENIYDALKMRYKDLDLSKYEIKDIK